MYYTTKIATCCYCGTKASLVLKGKDSHELSCRGCGAPLHHLKAVKTHQPEVLKPSEPVPNKRYGKKKSSKPKKRKSVKKRIFKELFDVIEDIFD